MLETKIPLWALIIIEAHQNTFKMAAINFLPETELAPSDPSDLPCLFVGKLEHIKAAGYNGVAKFLGDKVDQKTWEAGLESLSYVDSCNIWLNKVTVAVVANQVSRHNTPSCAHTVSKFVRNFAQYGGKEMIVIVCQRPEAFATGCAVSRAFPSYNRKSGATSQHNVIVTCLFVGAQDAPFTSSEATCFTDAAWAIQKAQLIVDAPCSEMHTDAFIEQIKEISGKLNVGMMVIQGEELDQRGFGGIYGVGKAAEHQPAMVVLSHKPPGANKNIALCGKGIVYDTGGLSIKGKTQMPGMKRDCGGAAGILASFYFMVKQGFTQNLFAVFCLAENAVGPRATRPDDVHTLYSGKTVEINNTDAEGRLVLGDGVAYARKDLKADIVFDMATLTSAQGISTGCYHGAVLTNNSDWEQACTEAGRNSGDLVFPIVYAPELHFKEFASSVADMKNSVADRSNAQSSCAGLFIGAHLGFDFPGVWIHVDMAAPVYCGERATGYGVALISTLFGKFSNSSILQSIAPSFNEEPTTPSSKKRRRQ